MEVAFRGIEMGSVEALLKAASLEHQSRPYSSGLEDSAMGGEQCSLQVSPLLYTCIQLIPPVDGEMCVSKGHPNPLWDHRSESLA